MSKPYVNTRPVANAYANANERIVEYSLPGGPGGLISIREHHDEPGHLIVELYQHDAAVDIRVGNPREGG